MSTNMEIKELKVAIPEGYEIDRENSTFEYIKFKPIEKLTYKDIAKRLFADKCYCTAIYGIVCLHDEEVTRPNNATSKEQLEKLFAINKLMNVAKYLNGDWKPLWNIEECKYYIQIDEIGALTIDYNINYNTCNVYFKSRELAQQAIDILGEDTIRLALSTDW